MKKNFVFKSMLTSLYLIIGLLFFMLLFSFSACGGDKTYIFNSHHCQFKCHDKGNHKCNKHGHGHGHGFCDTLEVEEADE